MLDAFERAGSVTRSLRFRDEHVSMVRDEDVPRFARLGVIASMQPVFVGEYSRFAEARVGRRGFPGCTGRGTCSRRVLWWRAGRTTPPRTPGIQ